MQDPDQPLEEKSPKIFTVSDLTERIKELLEEHFDFIWVEAEISNFSSPTSGHYYMIFKDDSSQIRAVMFRPQARYLRFTPEDGIKVIARGRIAVYQPRGEYQIVLDYLEPLGVGAMALAFEQLKKKLSDEGLFDKEIKRPLPFLPRRVAVITSPTGAAIRDFLKVLHRRFINIEVVIIPVKVQGREAAAEMMDALQVANRELDADLIVLTRGGGSMEDLWAFNNEDLARAIRASGVPVVSAVGHEIDTTISDMVADFRAPTPSAAAELLVVEQESLSGALRDTRDRIVAVLNNTLRNLKKSLVLLSRSLRDPRRAVSDSWLRIDELGDRLLRLLEVSVAERKNRLKAESRTLLLNSPGQKIGSLGGTVAFQSQLLAHIMSNRTKEKRMALSLLEGKINDLGPFAVLNRGYSITRRMPEKRIMKSASAVRIGDRVNIILAEGELDCLVENAVLKARS